MKYISVIILVVLLSWTWSLATGDRQVTLSRYQQVEESVEEDIRDSVQRLHPSTSEIFCGQLYTEVLQAKTEILVHFRCRAAQGSTDKTNDGSEQIFKGFIRVKSEDNFETWEATGGRVDDSEIRFFGGSTITPSGEGATPEAKDKD